MDVAHSQDVQHQSCSSNIRRQQSTWVAMCFEYIYRHIREKQSHLWDCALQIDNRKLVMSLIFISKEELLFCIEFGRGTDDFFREEIVHAPSSQTDSDQGKGGRRHRLVEPRLVEQVLCQYRQAGGMAAWCSLSSLGLSSSSMFWNVPLFLCFVTMCEVTKSICA